ncbi:hypothetical protein ABLE94_07420 [Gordonia sp. VNK1]|uniref:hypothetical protein n=1 Tax=Gordonia oleivorans TaxID=3156618 RepID=UPI0032B45047
MSTPVRLVALLSTPRRSIDLGSRWFSARWLQTRWLQTRWLRARWLSARRRERRIGLWLRTPSPRGSPNVAAGTHLSSGRLASGGVGASPGITRARR